jgi:hypothetical protein
VQLLTFDNVRLDENEVTIEVAGEGNLMYQVAGSYYLPWEVLPSYPELVELNPALTVDVSYDRTELNVDDSVTVNVTLTLNEPGSRVEWGLIDLGIPPGFSVQTEDLTAFIERYQETTAARDTLPYEGGSTHHLSVRTHRTPNPHLYQQPEL